MCTLKSLKSAHIELTSICNLRCKYCYNSNKLSEGNNDLDANEVLKLIDDLVNNGCTTFVFSGGEPFLRDNFLQILIWINKEYPSLKYRILTNGTILNDSIIEQLKETEGVQEIRVSIDGFSHDNTRGKNTFKRALKGALSLSNAGFNVGINTVLTKYNYRECISFYKFLNNLGINSWRVDVPFYCGAYLNNEQELIIDDYDELFKIYEDLINISSEHYKEFKFAISRIWHSDVLYGIPFNKHLLNEHPCDYHKHAITIRSNGDVSFCPSWNHIFGNIRTESLNTIWNRIQCSEFGKLQIFKLYKCKKCKYVKFCGGGCRADSLYAGGNYTDPDLRTCHEMQWLFEDLLNRLPLNIQNIYYDSIK